MIKPVTNFLPCPMAIVFCSLVPAGVSWTEVYGQNAVNQRTFNEPMHLDRPNLPLPTLGGKQFWTDYRWQSGWRVQQNAVTKHWRVLDHRNIRRGWGSRAACMEVLQQRAPAMDLQRGHAVILIHGLMRSGQSMTPLGRAIEEAGLGTPITFEYASTRRPVADHAAALGEVVEGLPEGTRLSFVGHSLGNIVVRYLVANWQTSDRQDRLARLHRVVMLGPPNQGAQIARKLSRTGLFELVVGSSGTALGPEWDSFSNHLATPPCPFGIIAGNMEDTVLRNPLIDRAGDLIVSVEETRLAGAADFLEVPCLHSFLMDNEVVQRAVIRFLTEARFTSQPTTCRD